MLETKLHITYEKVTNSRSAAEINYMRSKQCGHRMECIWQIRITINTFLSSSGSFVTINKFKNSVLVKICKIKHKYNRNIHNGN